MCGWALRSEGTPWVAQRVWAMPMWAESWRASASAASSATRPQERRRVSSPASTARPAES